LVHGCCNMVFEGWGDRAWSTPNVRACYRSRITYTSKRGASSGKVLLFHVIFYFIFLPPFVHPPRRINSGLSRDFDSVANSARTRRSGARPSALMRTKSLGDLWWRLKNDGKVLGHVRQINIHNRNARRGKNVSVFADGTRVIVVFLVLCLKTHRSGEKKMKKKNK
jgi:hypothetical protein